MAGASRSVRRSGALCESSSARLRSKALVEMFRTSDRDIPPSPHRQISNGLATAQFQQAKRACERRCALLSVSPVTFHPRVSAKASTSPAGGAALISSAFPILRRVNQCPCKAPIALARIGRRHRHRRGRTTSAPDNVRTASQAEQNSPRASASEGVSLIAVSSAARLAHPVKALATKFISP